MGDLGVLLVETLLEALHLILEEVVGLLQLLEAQTATHPPPCLAVTISPDLVLLLVVCLAPSLVVLELLEELVLFDDDVLQVLLILEQAGLVLLELCDEVVGLHDLLDVVVLQELNLLLLALPQLPDGHLILRLHHGVLVVQAVDLIL